MGYGNVWNLIEVFSRSGKVLKNLFVSRLLTLFSFFIIEN